MPRQRSAALRHRATARLCPPSGCRNAAEEQLIAPPRRAIPHRKGPAQPPYCRPARSGFPLPDPLPYGQGDSRPAMEQLVRALPAGTNNALVDAVIAASSAGEQAVTDAVALMINGAFQSEPREEQS